MLNSFCPLCGVLLQTWQGLASELESPDEALSWLSELRAIRATGSFHDSSVSGVGWLNDHGILIVPRHPDLRHTDRQPGQRPKDFFATYALDTPERSHGAVEPLRNRAWCYAVHDVCWSLLIARVDPAACFTAGTIAAHLLAIFYNTPTNEYALAPGHDYGLAAGLHNIRHGGYYSIARHSLNSSFLVGDPREPFHFDDDSLEDSVAPRSVQDIPAAGDGESELFCMLPYENIMLILTYLPSRDLCNLRLASRHLASRTSPQQLSQQFWSSRFAPDMEMGFVFAANHCPAPPGRPDWRTLYFKAREALRYDIFPGFRNRRRIWSILGDWCQPLSLRLLNRHHVSGSPYTDSPLEVPDNSHIGPAILCSNASFYPGNVRIPHGLTVRELTLYGRLFERQSVFTWSPQSFVRGCRLRASFVLTNGHLHLSGIRCCPVSSDGTGNGDGAGAPRFRAGLIASPAKEHEVVLGPGYSLECLDVLTTSTGILGLHFHMKSPGGSYSRILGDMETATQERGIGRLRPGQDQEWLGLVLGLDAYKVISISLIEGHTTPGDPGTCLQPFPWAEVKPAHSWHPKIPFPPPMWGSSVDNLSGQEPVLCYYMNFGGLDGSLLRSLTRVVFIMGGFPSVFLGMEFSYADGDVMLFGQREYKENPGNMGKIQCVQQAFPIDGPGGETITRVTSSYSRTDDAVRSITIATNMGRSEKFCLYRTDPLSEQEGLVQSLEAGLGEAFTSFFAMTKAPVGHYRGFVARCSYLGDQLSAGLPAEQPAGAAHNIPITDEILSLSSTRHMLAFLRGFALSAADTAEIVTIRVSINDATSSGYRRHITGLMLEYRDSRIPVILGQWITEIGSFSIPCGDRVSELTVWHRYNSHRRQVQASCIWRLIFKTVRGQTKEFHAEEHEPFPMKDFCLHFRETPYMKPKTIFWGCSHEWDDVRVLYSSKNTGRRDLMSPIPLGPRPDTPDNDYFVRQDIYVEESLHDGTANPAVSIEIACRGKDGEPSGLTFVYANGDVRTIGTRGPLRSSMTFEAGERLAWMEVGFGNHRGYSDAVQDIVLVTNLDRKLQLKERKEAAPLVNIPRRLVVILDPSCARQQRPATTKTERDDVLDFPEDANALVGFWSMQHPRNMCFRLPVFGLLVDKQK